FQKPRLFDFRSVAESKEGGPKKEQLEATRVEVHGPDGRYTLIRIKAPAKDYTLGQAAEYWELAEPLRDRLEPDRLKAILTGFTDFWAEKYVDGLTLKADDDKTEKGEASKGEKQVLALYASAAGCGTLPEAVWALAPCLAPAKAGEVPAA